MYQCLVGSWSCLFIKLRVFPPQTCKKYPPGCSSSQCDLLLYERRRLSARATASAQWRIGTWSSFSKGWCLTPNVSCRSRFDFNTVDGQNPTGRGGYSTNQLGCLENKSNWTFTHKHSLLIQGIHLHQFPNLKWWFGMVFFTQMIGSKKRPRTGTFHTPFVFEVNGSEIQ